jgi:hypothetical protein
LGRSRRLSGLRLNRRSARDGSILGRPGVLRGSRARARHALRRYIAGYPAVYLPLARYRHREAVLGPVTDVVIDGFPRSANTFALVAFQLAQNDHVRVAHHIHAPAHINEAVRRGIPVLVPIRAPEDAVLSAVIRDPRFTARQLLKSYVHFHEGIVANRRSFVVATFEQVTTDFGAVIDRLNARYGTEFRRFDQTEEHVEECFSVIEDRSRRPVWESTLGEFLCGLISADEFRQTTAGYRAASPAPVPEDRVARPSERRGELRRALGPAYRAPALSALRERADRVYAVLTRDAG